MTIWASRRALQQIAQTCLPRLAVAGFSFWRAAMHRETKRAAMQRETKKAPGVPGLFKVLKVSRGPNDSLDAAILSGGTNQARRGSRKRPDRRGLEPAARAVTTRRATVAS